MFTKLAFTLPALASTFLAEATPLITSSEWDTVATTVTETAKTAIAPALVVLAIVIAIPLAKKIFKTISR